MKANKVLKLLRINRVTLYRYLKSGKLTGHQLPSGHYDYDDDSVYALMGIKKRYVALYARSVMGQVSSQIEHLTNYASLRGDEIVLKFNDDQTGYALNRPGLTSLLERAARHEIKSVYIENLYALAPRGGEIIADLLEDMGCKVICMDAKVSVDEYEEDINLIKSLE